MKVAIYTRKSLIVENSESIETQIKLCKGYFKNENEFEIFEDEGFSGKNTKRPAFQRMMKLISFGKFNTLICYRLDRISRSVLDFSNILETLNKNNISFISLTEQFDTSTPMGRAMVYISSVFAQLERETIAERVKDSMLSLAKKGCWTGGPSPAGYIIIKTGGKSYLELSNPSFIKDCFESYLKLQSLYATHKIIKDKYLETPKQRENLRRILRSPMYVKSDSTVSNYLQLNKWEIEGKENKKGYLCYGVTTGSPTAIVSTHEAVIDPNTWLAVQLLLDAKRESFFKKESKVYWLSGILKCNVCGASYVLANSNKHSYYVCANRLNRLNKNIEKCSNNKYINAEKIENDIIDMLLKMNKEEFFKIPEQNSFDTKSGLNKLKKELINVIKRITNLNDKLELLSNEASRPTIKRIEELVIKKLELENEIEDIKIEKIEPAKINSFDIIQQFNKTIDCKTRRELLKVAFKGLIYNPIKDHLEIEF